MSKASNSKIRQIEQEKLGQTGKRVLVVEGVDDIAVFSNWLTLSFGADWEQLWVIAEAGKKSLVLEILQQQPNWIGVVDRDEWSIDKVLELIEDQSNLWVLPRFCIENYLIVPEELWSALPENQQQKVAGGFEQLSQNLTECLETWLKHGALWSVVNPLWEGLRGLGFKEALLDPEVVSDDEVVRNKLNQWHQFLEPETIFNNYQQRLDEAESKDQLTKLCLYVHGKKFYETEVNRVLNQLLGQQSANQRQKNIFKELPVPNDIKPLWQKMQLP